MAKKAKTISSATIDENVDVSQQAAAVADEVNASPLTDENSAGAVGESVSTAIHNPESESNGTSEGSSDPAAPAPAGAIEGDTHTLQSASGAAASEATAELVKPLTGSDPIETIVAETDTPTFVSTSPDVEAAASGINFEPSQGAADGIGANADPALGDDKGLADALVSLIFESGAHSLEELRLFADLGGQIFEAFPELLSYPPKNIRFERSYAYGTATFDLVEMSEAHKVIGFDLASGPDRTVTSIVSLDAAGKVSTHAIRVKSTRDGFRRAGLVHSKAGRTFVLDELTEEQLEVLQNDPAITIEYL